MTDQCPKSRSLIRINSVTHRFELDYLQSIQIPVEQHICSPPFSIEGYVWDLVFYPHGSESDSEGSNQANNGSHVSLYLRLVSETKEVQAEYSFEILEKTGKFSSTKVPTLHTFSSRDKIWGDPVFILKDEIETRCCKDGKLVLSCKIRVLSSPSGIDDSSGGLFEDIRRFWGREELFDVTFEVAGERLEAHRFMLASRSPVFKKMLYGPVGEVISSCVKISDMEAEVFKAVLRFIYTDGFNFECYEDKVLSVGLVRDLLVASDRFALPMLKRQCEKRLWMDLSMDTVLSTLSLAERQCSLWLKEKCLEFASNSENFMKFIFTEEYVQMMQSYPSLLKELCDKVGSISSATVTNAAKRQKHAG